MSNETWIASSRLQRAPAAARLLVVVLPMLSSCARNATPNDPGSASKIEKEPAKTELAASVTNPAPKVATEAVRPFRISFPDGELMDLRRRVSTTRWPDQETVRDRSQGVQLSTMQELASYWQWDYDWRKAEEKLNAWPQFVTTIDGVDVHFIHVRSRHPNALPLIMTHGWPGSVFELLKVIGPLTESHGLRRTSGRRLRSRSALDAGLRLLRPAEGYRLEAGQDCARVGRADETARLPALRGARWGLGIL